MDDTRIPTPFGWLPMSGLRNVAGLAASPAGVEGISKGLGAPMDLAAWLWRNTDMNTPETRERIYRTPPALGSDYIRGLLGGDPTPTPGRAWINDESSTGPQNAMPAGNVFGGLAPSSWPPYLQAALRRVIR